MKRKKAILACAVLVTLAVLTACAAPAAPEPPAADAGVEAGADAAPAAASQPAPAAPVDKAAISARPPLASGPIAATALMTSRDGDVVAMPLSAIVDVVNTEFGIVVDDRSLDFMAYVFDGELYVRASACPPCAVLAYSLDGGTLLCEACDTSFDARTGEGIGGACVDYPKAAVAYEVKGDVVSMKVADLVRAWDETLLEGLGPFPEEPIVVVEEAAAPVSRPSCC